MNALTELYPLRTEQQDPPSLSLVGSPRGLPTGPGLVGREPELRELKEFLREARHGAARVLCGHAGSGKSTLLDAAVELATAAGTRVLRCTGIHGGTPPELSGLRQVVWPVLGSQRWSLAPGQLHALEMLLVDGALTERDRARLPFTVLGVLETLSARQPLLLAVDDWDGMDESSREVFSFVARRTGGHPMAVLMTSRSHRTRSASLAGLPTLPVGPLTPAQSAALLATRRPGLDAQAGRELLATAAGNPLALLELPVRSEESLPYLPPSSDRLAAALAPGASRVPAATRDLLLVAALHPAGDLPLLLSAASRIGGARLDFGTVEPAEREGLVAFDGTRLRFSHPATAGAVVHDVDPRRCRAAHAALAAVLPRDSVPMLWHLSQAVDGPGPDPELAARLDAVHRHALEQCEPPMAVRLLRRAADLYSTPQDRGRCALRAAQLAHDLGLDHLTRATAHQALRFPLGPLGRLCAEALARPGGDGRLPADHLDWPAPAGPAEQESAVKLAQLAAPTLAGDPDRAEALLAFLDRLPERANDPRLLQAMATAGPVRRAATVIARVSAFPGLAEVSVRDLERLGEAALLAGDPLRTLDLYRQAERRYHFHDLPDQLPRVLVRQGLAHLMTGAWGQSEQSFLRCEELAEKHGRHHHAAAARLLGSLVRSLRDGTVHEGGAGVVGAGAVGAGGADTAGLSGTGMWGYGEGRDLVAARRSLRSIDDLLAVGVAWSRVESGDFAAGGAALATLLADPDRCPAALFALVPFAEAAAATNTADDARRVLRRLEDRVGPQRAPLVSAQLAVARAILADDQDAPSRYASAFAMDLSRWPFLEAPLRLAHGRWLRRRRQFAESRVTLRQAAATFTMMGAAARAARIAMELRASGQRAEFTSAPGAPQAATAAELLSSHELRIAQLAGRGLSNRQIGEALHLSPRTIGAYLYRIFPRLGVTARAQLAEALKDIPAA